MLDIIKFPPAVYFRSLLAIGDPQLHRRAKALDPDHKGRAINSAAETFGQVVFVTNDVGSIKDHIAVGLEICTINPKSKDKDVEYLQVE